MGKQSQSKRVAAGNGLLYPVLGIASCIAFVYMSFGDLNLRFDHFKSVGKNMGFVKRNGTHLFVIDEEEYFYINGWNSFWLIDHAVEEHTKYRVTEMLQAGANMGLTVCRTWGFIDGIYHAIQLSPGRYDERVLKGFDYVIAEAGRSGVRLLLSLVNNLQHYGGKPQYVKWAWEEGVGISVSNDSFFFDPSIRQYYKNYVKAILTRKNTITGVEYKDDPTIFGWELINEPRCESDPSGDTLQEWIEEMGAYVKSIDKNHLVTVGIEGFYGPKNPKRLTVNPGEWASAVGSDFVRNSNISTIDFASVHIYPDNWFHDNKLKDNLEFTTKWMASHIEDAEKVLNKPVMFTEFGWSFKSKGFDPSHREKMFKSVFDIVYQSARKKGAAAGSMVWQFFVEGMPEYNDEYGIVPWEFPSTYQLIKEHSCRLARTMGFMASKTKSQLKSICSKK